MQASLFPPKYRISELHHAAIPSVQLFLLIAIGKFASRPHDLVTTRPRAPSPPSFSAGGEGLNYAVSVDEIRKFLARSGNRIAQQVPESDQGCKLKELSRFRSQENDATVIAFDMFCTGKDNAEYVVPDNKTKAIFLRLDRNGDGNVDAVIFDFKRREKWDLSFWDEKFQGYWTLVGYHDDGTLKPTRFESYAEFQKRLAAAN